MQKKPKIIAVVGPTASGKSDLAVEVAKEFEGEVISADSRQVYKGLDIGSGKITKKEMQKIPHHLLDVSSPKKVFNIAHFKSLADKKIEEILKNKKLPIICGGTGFYIEAVTENILLPEVPPNKELRKKLEKLSLEKLQKMLLKLDPKRFKTIDIQNKVRLVRAIEISKALGKVPKLKSKPNYETLFIGILWDTETLRTRIHTRLLTRIKGGMMREIKRLHDEGVSWKRMHALGLEYRYGALYLQKKISKEETIEKLNLEIRHYAKRQMTWFQRNKKIIWIKPGDIKTVRSKVREFLG